MQIRNEKNLEIERLGNTEEGLEAGIDTSNFGFFFEMVSTGFYSNRIGSVVREITSNCFDSHIEAGVDDPVIINKGHDPDEGWYIEFIDVGVGLSTDRMNNVYRNYLSSTKRSDNTQLGGFGLTRN